MKRWWVALGWLAVVGGLAFWAWSAWFPRPEVIIRRRLAELARIISIAPNEAPAARLFNAQKIGAYFTPDVEVRVEVLGQRAHRFNGRQDIIEAAMAARNVLSSLKIQFLDVGVVVEGDGQSARAHLTLKADIPGEKVPEVEELELVLVRRDGDWLIQHAETVQTLH